VPLPAATSGPPLSIPQALKLKGALEAEVLRSKLATQSKFTLAHGPVLQAGSGLSPVLGLPPADRAAGLLAEHLESEDARELFDIGRYPGNVWGDSQTTPELEYWCAVDPEAGLAALGIQSFPPAEPPRHMLTAAQLEAVVARHNEALQGRSLPPVSTAAAAAMRMYTSMMFKKYNTLLRCLALDSATHARTPGEAAHVLLQTAEQVGLIAWDARPGGFLALRWRNRYVATIYLINEAAVKLGRLTTSMPVYRGVGRGAQLAGQWVQPDEFGMRGGTETSFMSVTKNRELALQFATNESSVGLIFELVMGAAGRGADLSALDMTYLPHEGELLFPACTALEVTRERVEGDMLVISCNVIAPPIE